MKEEESGSEGRGDRGEELRTNSQSLTRPKTRNTHTQLRLEGVWGTQPSLSGGLGASAPKALVCRIDKVRAHYTLPKDSRAIAPNPLPRIQPQEQMG
jgi:hypothetical protein